MADVLAQQDPIGVAAPEELAPSSTIRPSP
jgi:hypothetical protein